MLINTLVAESCLKWTINYLLLFCIIHDPFLLIWTFHEDLHDFCQGIVSNTTHSRLITHECSITDSVHVKLDETRHRYYKMLLERSSVIKINNGTPCWWVHLKSAAINEDVLVSVFGNRRKSQLIDQYRTQWRWFWPINPMCLVLVQY